MVEKAKITRKCEECGKETRNRRSPFYKREGKIWLLLCDECLAISRCGQCGDKLGEDEKEAKLEHCLSCLVWKNECELRYLESQKKRFEFQIKNQLCSNSKCGKFNDSRSSENPEIVVSKWCQACRASFGDSQRRINTIDTWPEKSTRVFSRVTGFKDV